MRVRFRKLLFSLLVLFLACMSSTALALSSQRFDLQIITADQSKTTASIVEALRKRFPTASVGTQITRSKLAGKQSIYLAVGPSALRYLTSSGVVGPIISTFTSHKVFHSIAQKPAGHASQVSGIYADPAPTQQFQLIALIYGKPIKIGVIIDSDNALIVNALRHSATQRQAEVSYEVLAAGEDISHGVSRLAEVQTILAIPDSAVYNGETIRAFLISTYRRNQAVVGFSAAMVKAGALATTYSDVDDIVEQSDEILSEYESTGRLPEPQFPKYFDVVVNEDVARSLNIVISDQVRKFSRKPAGRHQ